jgi:dTDP-4-amino-4,6-dideoxygalactose transaminase
LNLFINKREKIAKNYQKFFKDSENISYFINNNKDIKSAWHLFILNISFENLKISKNNFIQYLHNKLIGVQVHYIPNNYQPLYSDKKNNKLKFVGTKKYFRNSISIPIYPDLKKKDQLYVIKTIKECIDKFKK